MTWTELLTYLKNNSSIHWYAAARSRNRDGVEEVTPEDIYEMFKEIQTLQTRLLFDTSKVVESMEKMLSYE